MSTSKHTPGPWSVDDFGAGQRVVVKGRAGFSGDYRIADAHFSSDLARCARVSEMQANARLIAAAPELLEALEAARQQVVTLGGEVVEVEGKIVSDAIQAAVLAVIDAALAKAGAA